MARKGTFKAHIEDVREKKAKSEKELTQEQKMELAKERAAEARAKAEYRKEKEQQKREQLQQFIEGVVESRVQALAREISQAKFDKMVELIPAARTGKMVTQREYKKFTCPELIRLFGGWFTLSYAFSEKRIESVGKNKKKEVETDYYVCSQDVNLIRANERPPINEAISRLIGKTVYGFAIIAPATVFGEDYEDK